jgi:hypothetical protein
MSKLRELENIFFYFGFKNCSKNEFVNFLKIKENKYLVFRISKDKVADLIYEEYENGQTPCNSKPKTDESIKLGFEKDNDLDFLKEIIKKL